MFCSFSLFVLCSISDGDYEWINITEYEAVNITSPNYPLNYPNSIQCTWRITTCHNCSISFQIPKFDVEYPHDTLVLKKGLQTWKTNSFGKGDLYISYDEDLWLVFESDYSVSFTGFVLHIAHVEGRKIWHNSGIPNAPYSFRVRIRVRVRVRVCVYKGITELFRKLMYNLSHLRLSMTMSISL